MEDEKRVLFKGGLVYQHDGDVHHPRLADIMVAGNKILKIGSDLPEGGRRSLMSTITS